MSKTQPKKSKMAADSILTRYKSAQQGRQLRKKDRSMKAITQLLKSSSQKSSSAGHLQKNPGKDKNTTVKKCPQKSSSNKKVSSAGMSLLKTKQLLPNVLKKSVPEKKITLKPKYDMKVIARTNKRKLNTPHRGLILSPSHIKTEIDRSSNDKEVYKSNDVSSFSSELTVSDIVRLAEETDCLDDEDLMEILTCPSPVWWEDPPDDNYMEAPIFIRIPTNDTNEKDNSITKEYTEMKGKTKGNNNSFDIVVKINDTRIIEKRNKLEKILGNIKNKFDAHKNNEIFGSSKMNNTFNKSDRELKEVATSNTNNELNKITINSEGNEYDVLLSDLSINGEELLKELENMDIPIEGNKKNIVNNSDNKASNESNNSIVKMKLIDKFNLERTLSRTDREIPKTMPRLIKFPIEKCNRESPISSLGMSSECDSISDSNIQYLAEEENEVDKRILANLRSTKNDTKTKDLLIKDTQFFLDEDNKKLVTVSTDTEAMSDFESYIDKSDFITVYKIMSQKYTNEDDNEVNQYSNIPDSKKNKKQTKSKPKHNDTKLNSFFKKRKNTSKNSKKIDKTKNDDTVNNSLCDYCTRKSYIPIPDSNKKLCLRCSSIYEENCTFCSTDAKEENCTCTT